MSTKEVRLGLVGIGNCAASLIHGIEYYRNLEFQTNHLSPQGLIRDTIGEYKISSIKTVAALDIATDKVGRDLSEAIKSPSICTRNVSDIPYLNVPVHSGILFDGIGESSSTVVEVCKDSWVATEEQRQRISKYLIENKIDVLVNFLPVGSKHATKFYADIALQSGSAFVNAIPEPIGREPQWRQAFSKVNLPLIGDDVKSQVGATIAHRSLVELLSQRGYVLDKTYQLNFGGNHDFLNMMSRDRLGEKKRSKAQSILDVANRGTGMKQGSYHISPSDYIEFLGDQKIAFIRLQGYGFAGAPIEIELKLVVEDSPNSAGVIVDAVRYAKLAKDANQGGYLKYPSAWLMKAPAFPLNDSLAENKTDEWVNSLYN